MSVKVRRLTQADIPAFLDLIQALADYEKLPGPNAEARARLSRDALADPSPFLALIAERDSKPIGYAVAFPTYSTFEARPTLFLEDVFVLPEERGNGAGKALIKEVAREAVRRGCGRMEWNVLDWNEPAIAFYRQMGGSVLEDWRVVRVLPDAFRRLAE